MKTNRTRLPILLSILFILAAVAVYRVAIYTPQPQISPDAVAYSAD